MKEIQVFRHSHLVDPALAVWGWEIPVYLFLGGLAAGVMILTALLARRDPGGERPRWARWLPFSVPLLLSAGMLALFLDIEYKWHVYRFYLALTPSSPMSWGGWILLLVYPAALLAGLAQLSEAEAAALAAWRPLRALGLGGLLGRLRAWARARAGAVEGANVVLGLALGVYTGILLGTLGARAAWSSPVLGPLFLVSGVSTGAAFLMLFPLGHGDHAALRRWDVLAITAELVLLGLFLLGLWTSGATGKQAAALFLGGGYTAVFWALVVTLGLLVPLTLEHLEARRGLAPSRVTPALVLIGGLCLRWIVVSAGQAI